MGIPFPGDSPLAGLVERLQRARRRLALRTLVHHLVLVGLSALTLFCALEVSYALIGEVVPALALAAIPVPEPLAGWRPAPVPQHLMVVLGIGVAGMALAFLAFGMRRVPIEVVARAADRRFSAQECISTALEVASLPGRASGVITDALLHVAAVRAPSIDVARLAPITVPRSTAAVPVLLLLAALLTTWLPTESMRETLAALRPAGDAVDLTAGERAEEAATLAAIAATLKRDGRERSDPALEALAEQIATLGQRLAYDPGMGREALADSVERMRAAIDDAYLRTGASVADAQALAQLFNATAGATPPIGAVRVGSGRQTQTGPNSAVSVPPSTSRQSGTGTPPELRPPSQTATGTRGPGSVGAVAAAPESDAADEKKDEQRDLAGEAGDGDNGQTFAGGGGTPGDYAGFGTRALKGEATPRLGLAATGELLLQNPEGEGGRRTRLSIAPGAERQSSTPVGGGLAGAWQAATEHEVMRAALPVSARDLVGRYFQGMNAERPQ